MLSPTPPMQSTLVDYELALLKHQFVIGNIFEKDFDKQEKGFPDCH
jgi:hypothetical protein